jgi:excinuclease UvrABC helicase subunit UvrB
VANNLRLKENEALLLHGDMDQSERNKVITAFKRKEVNILVATDVAGKHIRFRKLSLMLILNGHEHQIFIFLLTSVLQKTAKTIVSLILPRNFRPSLKQIHDTKWKS